jgi:hypothetical protein
MPDQDLIGKDVRILRCEARKHGDNPGCVCFLIGGVERIAKRYETPFRYYGAKGKIGILPGALYFRSVLRLRQRSQEAR